MLVFTRKIGEQVVIGQGEDAVVVAVVDVRGDKVRIGFAAPEEVPVHRLETYKKIHGATTSPEWMLF